MKISVKYLLAVAVTLTLCYEVSGQGHRRSNIAGYAPKSFNVSLDLSYSERWAEIITYYKPAIHSFKDYLLSMIPLPSWILRIIPYSLIHWHDPEYVEEIRAVSELADIEFHLLYMINFIYEFAAFCTSIVVRTESERIIHGRNLDFEFANLIANLSASVNFYKNGELLFQGGFIAGHIGVHFGQKPGKFGVSLDERDKGSLIGNIYRFIFRDSAPALYLMRQVLEKSDSFDETVNLLKTTKIIAPCYYIVSGIQPHEGVVITRDPNTVVNMTWLSDNDPAWFVVETNYDRDEKEPDDDVRRAPAEQRLKNITQGAIGEQILLDGVLGLYPNLNNETILTAIYTPSTGYFNITLWL